MPDECPICERNDAEIERPGDYVKVFCPRCGTYILTDRGRKLFLMETPDQTARARASYAIRSRTSDEKPFKTNGYNVEILSQPLPDLPKQEKNLIRYLKEQAGDTHCKMINIKDRNALLGVVGAADEAALEDLLKWACEKDLVSLSQDGSSVKLTPRQH